MSMFTLVFGAVFLPVLMWIFNWTPMVILVGAFLAVSLIGIGGWHVFELCRAREDIVCVLDEEYVACRVPISGSGDTFKIAIADIAGISIPKKMSGVNIHGRNGECYWLSANFGIPARRIATVIREMRPEIPLM